MAKAKKKRNKAADLVERFVRPTEQREAVNDFQSAGAAVRLVPVISTLLRAGKLSQAEYDALNHYREQAHKAEDDCAQCGTLAPERMMGGGASSAGGSKIPVGVLLATPAIIETGRLEQELGSLLSLARAVAVEDMTLTRWCIQQSGGRERLKTDRYGEPLRDRMGRPTNESEIVPANPQAEEVARLELRFAARRIIR